MNRNKTGFRQATARVVLLLMLWVFVGACFTPRQAVALKTVGSLASAADTHAFCKCLMCKGGKKACCCSPKNGAGISALCDAAAPENAAPAALPRAVLPPVFIAALPVFTPIPLMCGPAQSRAAVKQAAPPLLPPPRFFS